MDWKGRIVANKNLPSLHEYVIDAEDNMSDYHILTITQKMDWKGRIVANKNLPSLHEYVTDAEDNMSDYHILTIT